MKTIIKKISQYNYSSRNGSKIEYLILHDTGNFKDTAKNNADYFFGGNRNASAHYFVDETSIYQVVEDGNSAWHVGDGKGINGITNRNSIGIEMCNSGGYIAKATVDITIELVRELMKKYNIDINHVKRHYDASKKICPRSMSDNSWALWNDFIKQLEGISIVVEEKPSTASIKVNYCFEFQKFYNEVTRTSKPLKIDGVYGENTQNALDALLVYIKQSKKYKYCLEFQNFYNEVTQTKSPLICDGVWGDNSAKAFQIINDLIKKFNNIKKP